MSVKLEEMSEFFTNIVDGYDIIGIKSAVNKWRLENTTIKIVK